MDMWKGITTGYYFIADILHKNWKKKLWLALPEQFVFVDRLYIWNANYFYLSLQSSNSAPQVK